MRRCPRRPGRGARARPSRTPGRPPTRAGEASSLPAADGRYVRRSGPATCPGCGPQNRFRCRSRRACESSPRRTSGLPSARSSTSREGAFIGSPDAPASWARSFSTSNSLSSSDSGSSSIAVERTRPPPQPGRCSRSSGRARQMMRSGARTQSARCSISSSRGSSAQWMSSKKRTSGCTSASVTMTSRAAHAISCELRSPSRASSMPDARPSTSATVSSSQHSRSFANASSSGSSSEIPAAALIISASGQYVTPSP